MAGLKSIKFSSFQKMSRSVEILYNKDLFSYITSFLKLKDFKKLASYASIVKMLHPSVVPSLNTLLYGQVQSGKTGKIMDYIQSYRPGELKVLVLQNSRFMLSQYTNTFNKLGIKFLEINHKNATNPLTDEQVIITIHNKFRVEYVNEFLENNNIKKDYGLILDESDQYIQSIRRTRLFKNAKNVLHVTATPFIFTRDFNNDLSIDNVVEIKPKDNYVGIDKVEIRQIAHYKPKTTDNNYVNNLARWNTDRIVKILCIINEDFIINSTGFMLINCFRFVKEMVEAGGIISNAYYNVPVIIASTRKCVIINGVVTNIKAKSMQEMVDRYRGYEHIIVIANRMSNRGVNYTDSTYSRNITHQIAVCSGTYATFLQKCRIFGNRGEITMRPILYAMITKSTHTFMVDILKDFMKNVVENVKNPDRATNLSVVQLKALCKQHALKGYSGLRKNDILKLLIDNGVEV